jgi:hypothetical protein
VEKFTEQRACSIWNEKVLHQLLHFELRNELRNCTKRSIAELKVLCGAGKMADSDRPAVPSAQNVVRAAFVDTETHNFKL